VEETKIHTHSAMSNKLTIQRLLNAAQMERGFHILRTRYGIEPKQHSVYPELYQFTYDMIESYAHRRSPIVTESRGLILDSNDSWSVVAYPFNRFFNYGEFVDDQINWSKAKVQEKVDGSLMILYWAHECWNVATKGSPSANGNVGDESFTFEQLFWVTWNKQFGVSALNALNKNCTYMFELTSRYNRVVTDQSENEGKLTLIGVRDNNTFEEKYVTDYPYLNPVQHFPFSTIDEIKHAAEVLDFSRMEGFVVVDDKYNRVKVKSPKYVMVHHIKDSLNEAKILDLVRSGEDSEVFAYFPDIKQKYETFTNAYQDLSHYLTQDWLKFEQEFPHNGNVSRETRKEMAKYILSNTNSFSASFLFSKLDGKVVTANDWLSAQSSNKLVDILNVR
jgi:hypothetical protein